MEQYVFLSRRVELWSVDEIFARARAHDARSEGIAQGWKTSLSPMPDLGGEKNWVVDFDTMT